MTTQIICIPVADDGQVGHSWGKARTLAVATVTATWPLPWASRESP